MNLYIITLFEEAVRAAFERSIFKRAIDNDVVALHCINLRDFSSDKFGRVDDYPYGKHEGMLLRADIVYDAVTSIPGYDQYPLLYPCPKGDLFSQSHASDWSKGPGLVWLPGYYEGVDARLFELLPIQAISMGNFVLSSGDLPALMMAEATVRLLDGVVGKSGSVANDSVISGLLEHPHYTKPATVHGMDVPAVLTSGHHQAISDWREVESLRETLYNRPSLLASKSLDEAMQERLMSVFKEKENGSSTD